MYVGLFFGLQSYYIVDYPKAIFSIFLLRYRGVLNIFSGKLREREEHANSTGNNFSAFDTQVPIPLSILFSLALDRF